MEDLFKIPKTISGLTELYKKAKQHDKKISLKDVKEFLKNKYTSQIHKPLPNRHMHFPRISTNQIFIKSIQSNINIIKNGNSNYSNTGNTLIKV